MRRRKQEESKGTPEWMLTYSDLVTLLLCFFVLLFSFSEIDAQKFKAIMKSFQGSLGVMPGGTTIQASPYVSTSNLPEELTTKELEELEDFKKLMTLIDEYSEDAGLDNKIVAQIDERGLIIRVLDNVFFDSGRAEIKPEAKKVLVFLSEIFNKDEFKDKQIKIEGHTDSDPIIVSTSFPTNWELSVIRAANVLRFLVEKQNISGDRISAAGYSYYRPVVPNDSPENKAKNRRVDIVILKSTVSQLEPN